MMKKNKNQKGFALVLALVLMMAMSLLGGALIVISSGDHRSNNVSDDYQQTFYVAETALLEAEKSLIDSMMGPWIKVEDFIADKPTGMSDEEEDEWDDLVVQMTQSALENSGFARNIDKRDLPQNQTAAKSGLDVTSKCFESFRNINRAGFEATQHRQNLNFGSLIEPIFTEDLDKTDRSDQFATVKQISAEKNRMFKFRYEYFTVNIGSAAFRGTGSSVAKTSTNVQNSGTAYRIYGCGIMMPETDSTADTSPSILIPLESVVILSN